VNLSCSHLVEYMMYPIYGSETPTDSIRALCLFKTLPNVALFDFWCGGVASIHSFFSKVRRSTTQLQCAYVRQFMCFHTLLSLSVSLSLSLSLSLSHTYTHTHTLHISTIFNHKYVYNHHNQLACFTYALKHPHLVSSAYCSFVACTIALRRIPHIVESALFSKQSDQIPTHSFYHCLFEAERAARKVAYLLYLENSPSITGRRTLAV
jgi:hypothetical protein